MTAIAMQNACHQFAQVAAPYLYIRDESHYDEALELIEGLLEEVGDDEDNPLNAIINLLSLAIESYENQQPDLVAFEHEAQQAGSDISVLRLLMQQHQIGMADLPEIGSKSMVSRVLSGERHLNKQHIKALCERFGISPNLFF
tara:strand:- start:655 stop:1083 length:429 start_codon:yes stop_codon:yes gene_type:complete